MTCVACNQPILASESKYVVQLTCPEAHLIHIKCIRCPHASRAKIPPFFDMMNRMRSSAPDPMSITNLIKGQEAMLASGTISLISPATKIESHPWPSSSS